MTDAEIALKTISGQVRNFTQGAGNGIVMLFAQVGRAKNPKDTAAIADGRATIVAKLGGEGKLKAVEDAIKDLGTWAEDNLKA